MKLTTEKWVGTDVMIKSSLSFLFIQYVYIEVLQYKFKINKLL